MDDEWEQIYAKLPHYEKVNGEWFYVHFGGETMSKVSDKKAKDLDKEQEFWNKEWEKLAKELENK